MAEIKQLKEGDKVIYPLTSTKAIVDESGNRVTIPTKTSQLINDSDIVSSEPTEEVVGDIEATIVTTAIRKTAQTLTEEEKRVARANIGAASTEDITAAISQSITNALNTEV